MVPFFFFFWLCRNDQAQFKMSPKMFQNITVYLNHFYFFHYKYVLGPLLAIGPPAAVYAS